MVTLFLLTEVHLQDPPWTDKRLLSACPLQEGNGGWRWTWVYCFVNSRAPSRSSLLKTGPLPSYFCVKRPWLLFVNSVEWTVAAETVYVLYSGVGGRNTLHYPGVGGRKTLLCAAAAAITRRGGGVPFLKHHS